MWGSRLPIGDKHCQRIRSVGFTLLELLVVIAIIAVMTAYVAPRYLGNVGKSEVQAARNQMQALHVAMTAFRLDVGRFPTQAEGLNALIRRPSGSSRWRGPYLDGVIPQDPWGQEYRYAIPGQGGKDYAIVSLGSDGRPGGTDTAADISR